MQMLRILSGCAFGAALLTSTARVSAADPAPAPSGSALPEIGRVTTSDRRSEPIDRTARPTFVIDRARLDATGARTVSDALRSIPGVAIYSFGPFGSQSDYGIRGTNSAQTLVLLDGVPIANVSSGTIDLGTFPLVNVSRIEVVESGSSTLYGTSAIGGVINIITGARRGAEVLLSAGSFGDDDVRLGAGDGKIGVAFERHVATNAFAYPMLRYGTVTFPAATRTNSWATQTALRFTALESFGSGFSVRADLGGDATRSAVPGRLDFPSPRALQSVARNNALLEVTKTFSNSALSLTLSGARSALSYSDPDSGGETNTYDARTQ
ncbi:MAG: TonB-dependent receptor, partial [Candidatus Eremiobacteraeota bacterium]|nr:TonB-dependent receptor [Candidatus Eremiobacteraeota bacterium]